MGRVVGGRVGPLVGDLPFPISNEEVVVVLEQTGGGTSLICVFSFPGLALSILTFSLGLWCDCPLLWWPVFERGDGGTEEWKVVVVVVMVMETGGRQGAGATGVGKQVWG